MKRGLTRIALVLAVTLALSAAVVGAVAARGGFGGPAGMTAGSPHGLIGIVADQTGLSVTEVQAKLAEGKSLASVVQDAGKDLDNVVSAAMSGIDDRIKALVDAGRLKSDQADAYRAAVEQRIRDMLDWTFVGTYPGVGRGYPGWHAGAAGGLLGIVAEQTGLTAAEVREKLTAGKSLAAIVEEAGADLDAVVAAAMSGYEEQLQSRVDSGTLTEEQADALKALREANLRELLEQTGTFATGRSGFHGGFRGGRSHDWGFNWGAGSAFGRHDMSSPVTTPTMSGLSFSL